MQLGCLTAPTNNSGLRDNHTRGTVADFLREQVRSGSKLSIASAYFTIYAYDALKAELEGIEHLVSFSVSPLSSTVSIPTRPRRKPS